MKLFCFGQTAVRQWARFLAFWMRGGYDVTHGLLSKGTDRGFVAGPDSISSDRVKRFGKCIETCFAQTVPRENAATAIRSFERNVAGFSFGGFAVHEPVIMLGSIMRANENGVSVLRLLFGELWRTSSALPLISIAQRACTAVFPKEVYV